jgi:Fe-S cluster assembly iron-binding protein IscA
MKSILKTAWLFLTAFVCSATALASVSVSISPTTVKVQPGGQTQFSAVVNGSPNSVVIWSLAGINCTGIACGQITDNGLYTAPSVAPNSNVVTVTATSLAELSASASAAVIIGSSSDITVTVSPMQAKVLVGQQQIFAAYVSGTTITNVTWSLSGPSCNNSACGSVTQNGVYTAPASLPAPAQVTVLATSVADPTKSGSAAITVALPVSVSVSPTAAQVAAGTQEQFTATVLNTSNTAVTWSLAGGGCSGPACGTISTSGLYTAPSAVPSPAQVSVTATSVADSTKSSTATVTVIPPVSVTISPTTARVLTGASQQFTATVLNTKNTAVNWSLSGSGCSGSGCGAISTSGLYTAPSAVPSPAQVSVKATSVADSTKSGTSIVTVIPPVSVTVSPTTARVHTGASQQFAATVLNTSNTAVTWSLSGGGCSGSACGTISTSGLYTAPSTVPSPAQVSVTATSAADSTKYSTAIVTVIPPVSVTISPTAVQLLVGAQQQFTATVLNTSNTAVTWSVSGSGCSGSACGTISASGLYTAPASSPTPSQIKVTATSVADSTKSANATVTITGPVSVNISPASVPVVTGASQQFTASVNGSSNTAVSWSIAGKGCTGAACGVITSAGLYTAPATVPNPSLVTVTATSAADSTKSNTASVTVIPAVAVSVSPAKAQLVTGDQQQFSATVTGTSNTGVTWRVSGSGCSGSTCGTISAGGLYMAPAAVPSPAQVSVTATTDADSTKSATAIVTIIAPVVVTISPASAAVAVNGQQQFHAKVTGSTNTAVDWSISGAGCSGSACGSIGAGGLYTAPATIPSPAMVTVKATSQIDASLSASATVTIVANQNFKLQGQYVFRFTGFDSEGAYQAIGSFTADGNGNISAGLEDVNRSAAPATNVTFTGTYQVGADDRGTLTLSSSTGAQTFRFAINMTGTSGRFIEFDASGIRGSGVIERQDPTTFDLATFKGAYVVSLAGEDNTGQRIGALALLYFNGDGSILGESMDVNDGGTVAPTFGSFQGIYRVDGTGRGIVDLSIPAFEGGSFEFAFYVVSASKLVMLSTDQLSSGNPIFGGPAELQSGAPYSASSFSGPTTFSLAGKADNKPDVYVGRISFDGISEPLAEFDENTGGTISTDLTFTGGYSVSVNGPGTLNLDNSNGSSKTWDIYAIGPNHAFLMDVSTDSVGMGELEPQAAETTFSNSDILGTYVVGSGEPLVSTTTLSTGVDGFDGKKTVSGEEDISSSSALLAAQLVAGTYSVSGSLNNGRGTLLLTAPSGDTIALWVTSASELLGLEIGSSDTQPVILYFER